MFDEIVAKNTDEVAGTDNMTAILVKLFNDNLSWIMQIIININKYFLNICICNIFRKNQDDLVQKIQKICKRRQIYCIVTSESVK